ncbi:MAG: hypothetical protein JKX98_03960 [Alcanivoracaceae bacterium]|nr:hypothetical protein [Alcanivoracaceae bacterium]
MSSQEKFALAGGWSKYRDLTTEDKAVFDEAMKNHGDCVNYSPTSVSTQVVAELNFRFKCTASIPPAEIVWKVIIEIFQPLKGEPYVYGIIRI